VGSGPSARSCASSASITAPSSAGLPGTGGLPAIWSHRLGGPGKAPWLTPEQQEALAQDVATGRFRNAVAIGAWVNQMYGVSYTEGGMDSLLERLRCAPNVPRPLHTNANLADQEAWKKGGLRDTLHAAGIALEAGVGWADEMRLGLIGTMRRVWGRRGVKVRQRLQIVYEWRYLHLVVEPSSGTLWWFWSHAMRATVARTLIGATQKETDLAVLVWDRAPSHRDATVQAMGLPLIEQPPGTRLRVSPELNPVERVFEYLRGQIEGAVYPTIGDKVAAVEAILEELDAHPERVQALTRWRWTADTLAQLPEKHAA